MNALANGRINLGHGHQYIPTNDSGNVLGVIRHDSMDVALVVREDDGRASLHAWGYDGRLIARCQPLLNELNAPADYVTVPSSDAPAGAQYPRSLVEAINAVMRDCGRSPIATIR